ncbi:hypothetical protein TRFO_14402 [Tritrichomonas foetus]|uniref:Reverse transcriptase zinc-binding domain-containing protein n=1 Tax=Tritrichomonas foetus TaxID=1144522 RepID=A0A1J4KZF3_9EUKA|nr:hypothetical protein TRFO_14402 [Tritrichomonas foetus]|eukprot:OHT15068.1 hypothetical protein TRFO_14402 [Tritrichomonas foetus]
MITTTFIIPKLDYVLMNGLIPSTRLKQVDLLIRHLIHKDCKSTAVPVDSFYTHWADGGFSIPNLVERSKLMQIKLFCMLKTSPDDNTRKLFNRFIQEEMVFRKVLTDPMVQRFEHILEKDNKMLQSSNRKTCCIFGRAFKASASLDIGVQISNDSEHVISIKDMRKPNDEAIECADHQKVNIIISKILRERHKLLLYALPMRGHSFKTLEKSKCSNAFIINPRKLMNNKVQQFCIAGRANCLPTKEVIHFEKPMNNKICPRCNRGMETLHHILNNCRPGSLCAYKSRHDEVVSATVDLIKETFKPYPSIHLSKSINLEGLHLDGNLSRLLPDIWFKDPVSNKVYIIEVTVPYGLYSDDGTASLDKRRNEKINKYSPLVAEVAKQLNIIVSFHVIVVSSLGCVTRETYEELKRINSYRKVVRRTAIRYSEAALGSSCKIFWSALHPTDSVTIDPLANSDSFSDHTQPDDPLSDTSHEGHVASDTLDIL